jgi:hypothetical protein
MCYYRYVSTKINIIFYRNFIIYFDVYLFENEINVFILNKKMQIIKIIMNWFSA